MNQWKLQLSEEVRVAMEKAILRKPHLEALINQRLQALLSFPPTRWFRVDLKRDQAAFFPESGQKIRFTGLVDFKARMLHITRFSFRE
jgi:hypothetical protein